MKGWEELNVKEGKQKEGYWKGQEACYGCGEDG
jgi:hypothetical protein